MSDRKTVSNLKVHLGYWMRFVSNHVSHAFACKVEAEGVTVAEWVVMRGMFEQTSTINPSQLADSLGLTRGAVSKLIDRLEHKKLINRKYPKEDRRYQTIELTTAGKKLVPKLGQLADQNDHEFFGHLSDKERSILSSMLQELVHWHAWKDLPIS